MPATAGPFCCLAKLLSPLIDCPFPSSSLRVQARTTAACGSGTGTLAMPSSSRRPSRSPARWTANQVGLLADRPAGAGAAPALLAGVPPALCESPAQLAHPAPPRFPPCTHTTLAKHVVPPPPSPPSAGIYAMSFDLTGSRLITCEADKTIKMWKEDESATPESHPIDFRPPKDIKRF